MNPEASYSLSGDLALIAQSVQGIVPEVILAVTFLMAILAEIWPGNKLRNAVPWIAVAGVIAAGGWAMKELLGNEAPKEAFLGMISVDRLGSWFKVLMVVPAVLSLVTAQQSRKLKGQSAGMGEFYILMLAMLMGLFFLPMSTNLLMMFLALELVSLPSYVLTAYSRLNKTGAESALKYVIFGCFSSGIMAYGLSWLFGITGTLDPFDPAFISGLQSVPSWVQVFVLVMVLGGLSFKIGVFPFHFWVPDVYEGSPYPVAAFFSVAPKVAAFAALMRFMTAFQVPEAEALRENLTYVLAAMALGSMVVGNLSALFQTNFRRMLAYSSIAQAGYLLAGLATMQVAGSVAVSFYLGIYMVMTYAAFMVAGWMSENMGTENLDDLKGSGLSMPRLAVIVAVVMVSLAGLPPTAGFIGKLEIFLAAMSGVGGATEGVMVVLMVAMVLNTVVALFYYLRPPVVMVFKNPVFSSVPALHGWQTVALLIMAFTLILLGVFYFDGLINFLTEIVKEIQV